jgi:amino acid permease
LEYRFVFASVGYGPGIALYLIFGIAAAFSGWILWRVFLGLDSSRYPLLSYGDTFFRVYGKKSRHFINVTQSLQQFMTVSVLILACGQTIAQLANESICFIACMIIFMVIGMTLGMNVVCLMIM